MSDNIKKIGEVISKMDGKKGINAKTLTLIILALIFIIGVVGSFEFIKFNMADYALFLEKFVFLFTPLIVSIGVGSTAKTIVKKDE